MRRKAEDPISTIEMLDPTRFFLRTRMSSRGIPVNELKDEAEANGFDWALILERLKDPERYLWHTHRDGTVTVATRTDAPPPPPQERYLDEQERMAAQKWSDIRRSRVRALEAAVRKDSENNPDPYLRPTVSAETLAIRARWKNYVPDPQDDERDRD